jgi:DNA-binding SARP family transcriptional activator
MQCSRSGCSKQLRAHNTKGVCSSGCESPDAPFAAQAAGVKRAPASTSAARAIAEAVEEADDKQENIAHAAVLAKFRTVAEALGFDPDEVLAEAAEQWIEAAGAAVKQVNDETE